MAPSYRVYFGFDFSSFLHGFDSISILFAVKFIIFDTHQKPISDGIFICAPMVGQLQNTGRVITYLYKPIGSDSYGIFTAVFCVVSFFFFFNLYFLRQKLVIFQIVTMAF